MGLTRFKRQRTDAFTLNQRCTATLGNTRRRNLGAAVSGLVINIRDEVEEEEIWRCYLRCPAFVLRLIVGERVTHLFFRGTERTQYNGLFATSCLSEVACDVRHRWHTTLTYSQPRYFDRVIPLSEVESIAGTTAQRRGKSAQRFRWITGANVRSILETAGVVALEEPSTKFSRDVKRPYRPVSDEIAAEAIAKYRHECACTEQSLRVEASTSPSRHVIALKPFAAGVRWLIPVSTAAREAVEQGHLRFGTNYGFRPALDRISQTLLLALRPSGRLALPTNKRDWPDKVSLLRHGAMFFEANN